MVLQDDTDLAGGKKISNAKFIRVLHNGQLVQENGEVEGGTRAHMPIEEAAFNPRGSRPCRAPKHLLAASAAYTPSRLAAAPRSR